jgi:hypothetical protein
VDLPTHTSAVAGGEKEGKETEQMYFLFFLDGVRIGMRH